MNTKTEKKLKHQSVCPCTHCSSWKYNGPYCLMRMTFKKMTCPNASNFCRFKLCFFFGRKFADVFWSKVESGCFQLLSNIVVLSPSSQSDCECSTPIALLVFLKSCGCFSTKPPAEFHTAEEFFQLWLHAITFRLHAKQPSRRPQAIQVTLDAAHKHCITGSMETSVAYWWHPVTPQGRSPIFVEFPRMWYKFCATLTQTSRRGTFLVQCPCMA
jgi:hypothetical protein